jgi:hypothetical protein
MLRIDITEAHVFKTKALLYGIGEGSALFASLILG